MSGEFPAFVLVHSPLVGPSTWEPVARELEARGRAAIIPSLLPVVHAPAPQWRQIPAAVAASAEQLSGAAVLVGHSGAGPLLPVIAEAIRCPVAAMIFVDAFPPPPAGTAALLPDAFLDQLRLLARDGVLPPWSEWFGADAMRQLIPDDDLRTRVTAEMPRLPLSYFEARSPMPHGWDRRPCGYLLLSEDPYAAAAADARTRGWPVAGIEGASHLHAVTHPSTVSASLLALERTLLPE